MDNQHILIENENDAYFNLINNTVIIGNRVISIEQYKRECHRIFES